METGERPFIIADATKNGFIETLNVLPKSGIAYRGDNATRARQIKQNGLTDKESFYVAFVPLPYDAKSLGTRGAEVIYRNLWEGFRYGISFSDPWTYTGVRIDDPKFNGYLDHFSSRRDRIPAINLFTPPDSDRFIRVNKEGSAFVGPSGTIMAGTVERFGAIPKKNVLEPIIPTLEDIKKAESRLIELLKVKDLSDYEWKAIIERLLNKDRLKAVKLPILIGREFSSFNSPEQEILINEFLRWHRDDFFGEITNVVMDKFISTILHQFG